ncbi:MAG: Dabb family protein [Micropruina sp.]|nr:Dabb family protein [Micropruina sp.]
MIKHVVLWQFAEQAEGRDKAANVELVSDRLKALPALVPGIESFEVVTPQDGLESTFDLMLVSSFADVDALGAYVVHPEHQQVAQLIGKVRTERHCVDYDPSAL